jgi:hypothetical protein
MAIAVIGGLLVSTVLSLVFVPAFFMVMDDVGRALWHVFGRFVGPTDEPDEEADGKPARTSIIHGLTSPEASKTPEGALSGDARPKPAE